MGYIGISKVTLPIMGWQSYGQQLDWLLAVKIRQGLLQPWWQRFLMISPSQQSGGFKQRTWWEKHQNAGCSKQHFLDMCNNFHTLSWFPRAKDNFNEGRMNWWCGWDGFGLGYTMKYSTFATWSAMSRLRLGVTSWQHKQSLQKLREIKSTRSLDSKWLWDITIFR